MTTSTITFKSVSINIWESSHNLSDLLSELPEGILQLARSMSVSHQAIREDATYEEERL